MTKSSPDLGLQQQWTQRLFSDQKKPALLWRNFSNPNSLRLTVEGKRVLTEQLELVFYKHDIPELTNRQLLQLDHLIQSPYFIRHRKMIYLFGEQDSIMLSLHANDLGQYLDNLQIG